MSARIYLDDPLHTYNKHQVDFLRRVTVEMPDCILIRACHGASDVRRLLLAFDVRITAEVGPYELQDQPASDEIVARCRELPRRGLARALGLMPRPAPVRVVPPAYQERERVKRG